MNRSEMFMLLIGKKPWTDYEWAKQTKITRATFGNNRKNEGKNIKANTLEAMAKACGTKSDNKSNTSQTGDYKGRRLLICHNTIDFTKNNIYIFTGII